MRVCLNLSESTDNLTGKRRLDPPEERESWPLSLRPYLIYLALNRVHNYVCHVILCIYAVYTENTRCILLQVHALLSVFVGMHFRLPFKVF